MAQPAGGPPAGGAPAGGSRFGAEIALVDIQYIFKSYSRVKLLQTDLEGDKQRDEAALKKDFDTIKQLQDQLNELKPGNAEYSDRERRVVGLQADYNARMTLMRKELIKQSAKLHCRIYQEIQNEIDAWASANGVVAVLVYNSDVMDPEKPETVQAGLQNQVLWHHKNLDISQFILQRLEQRAGPVQTGTAPNYGFPRNAPATPH
jgi:Skp family chaperone for outer membrane proteins